MMTQFHAVMLDETGCEFGVDVEAASRAEAYDELAECYMESRCVQLESPQDTADRQARIDRWAQRQYDNPDWELD